MLIPVLLLVLTVFWVYPARNWIFLQNHPVRQGIWFGLPAILAQLAAGGNDLSPLIGLADAQPLTAAFCFGPVPALTAGIVSAAGRALSAWCGLGTGGCGPGTAAILIISLYGAVLTRFIMDDIRPGCICAGVAAGFGGVLRLGLVFLLRYAEQGEVFESLRAGALPLCLLSALAVGPAVTVAVPDGGRMKREVSWITLVFFLFGISFGTSALIALKSASRSADELLRHNTAVLKKDLNDILGFALHRSGRNIARGLCSREQFTTAEMQRLADYHGLDELSVFDAAGKPLASNDADVRKSRNFTRDNLAVREFYRLIDGKSEVVIQNFRNSISAPETVSRYVGVPLHRFDGLLQLGYHRTRLEREFGTFYLPQLSGYPVVFTGFLLIADADQIIGTEPHLHPELLRRPLADAGFSPRELQYEKGRLFTLPVCGVLSRCVLGEAIGGWRIYLVLPLTDVYVPVLRILFISALSLFLFCLFCRLAMRRTRAAKRELALMQAREKERVIQDVELARRIQLSELRDDDPETPYYRLRAVMRPARSVGGDFYDYYELEDRTLRFGIADVSGKGMPAAIFMMKAKTLLHLNALRTDSLLKSVAETNRQLCRGNEARMFVTAWYGAFHPADRTLEYICAGHNAPLIVHADGTLERVNCPRAIPLGIRPAWKYTVQQLKLAPGDRLFLYTDGVTEALNADGQLYGETRLHQVLTGAGGGLLIEAVRQDLAGFAGESPQSDDITMLSLLIK